MKNKELAQRIQTSEAFVSMMLNGKRRPSWETAILLASIFDTSESFWMNGDVEEMQKIVSDYEEN